VSKNRCEEQNCGFIILKRTPFQLYSWLFSETTIMYFFLRKPASWTCAQTNKRCFLCENRRYFDRGVLSDERMDLQFTRTLVSMLCQRNFYRTNSHRTYDLILLSRFGHHQHGRPGPSPSPPGTGWPSVTLVQWVHINTEFEVILLLRQFGHLNSHKIDRNQICLLYFCDGLCHA
jgi:hypothetical protein